MDWQAVSELEFEDILYHEADGIARITINRPEVRNAVDGPTADRLAEAFTAFDADDASDVAVLRRRRLRDPSRRRRSRRRRIGSRGRCRRG